MWRSLINGTRHVEESIHEAQHAEGHIYGTRHVEKSIHGVQHVEGHIHGMRHVEELSMGHNAYSGLSMGH